MIWDVRLRKALRHQDTRFQIDVQFCSAVSRLVLFGPSGAGKTQTLKMLAGIVQPDQGRVAVAGRVLFDSAATTNLTPQQRHLGYVFQDYALFPHLTVHQNIAFACQRRTRAWLNPGRAQADPAATHWLQTFKLQAVAGLYPHQISGGQRQRTALARSLVNNPTALLLDEPFAALDTGLRRQLRDELRELLVALKIPMLLITHDAEDVQVLADQVVHLQDGRVHVGAASGAASGALSGPASGAATPFV